MTFKFRRIPINLIRAKSLIHSSKQAIESVSALELKEVNLKTILRELYEGLRQFCEAIGYFEGYKFSSHEEITYFLKEILKENSISTKYERYRKLRNGINYYGDDISIETVKEAIKEIPDIIIYLGKYMKISMKPCFIDIHCHLEMIPEPEEAIRKAKEAGVDIIVAQGVKPEANRKVLEFASMYKEVKAALGLYPIDALSLSDSAIDQELSFILENSSGIIALGEVGIDYKEFCLPQREGPQNSELRGTSQQEQIKIEHERQKKIFRKIVLLAKELDKPIIIHSRKAEKEIIEILEEMGAKKVIMHCFSGKFSLVQSILKNGWYLTIPTSVKNSEHFQKIAQIAPIEQLFCETDSPYLHPDRRWPNEPANVVESYKKLAEIKKISIEEVKYKIFTNYNQLFAP